jgi:hypothetical protein
LTIWYNYDIRKENTKRQPQPLENTQKIL